MVDLLYQSMIKTLLKEYPEIAKEWHPHLNGFLTPATVTPKSAKRAWWLGKCGHEWSVKIGSRTSANSGCPYCTGNRACQENCLATLYPEIAKEWHPTRNQLLVHEVTCGSHKKVWWLGKCGHEWDMVIKDRALQKSSCPFCDGKRVNSSNCLETLNAELSKEWHPVKNGLMTPSDVTSESNKKVWWLGKCGHEWQSPVHNRNHGKRGCPYCVGRKACLSNCLVTKYPELSKEWHPTLNTKLTPFDVVGKSGKKVWWLGKCGHEWNAKIVDRACGNDCPFCTGRIVCESNCLAKLSPEVAKEWHQTKNDMTPFDITNKSHWKVWWLCNCGHEWQSIISNRTGKLKSGCPKCQPKSKAENIIRDVLELLNCNYKQEFKIKECKNKKSLPFDFALFDTDNLVGLIEYQGEQHYKPTRFRNHLVDLEKIQIRDKIKANYCAANKIPLLIMPYWTKDIPEVVKQFITSCQLGEIKSCVVNV